MLLTFFAELANLASPLRSEDEISPKRADASQ